MPYCPNCGAANPDAAKFCSNCGVALPVLSDKQEPPPSSTQPAVGSRVSFVAADGKTYTGTIKDVKGDQYKIGYDGYDFETLLSKNQFVLVNGTTHSPTYTTDTAVKQPSVRITQTPKLVPKSSSFITHLGLWGSLAIMAGFFMEWLNAGNILGDNGQSITGLQIVTYASDLMDKTAGQNEFVIGLLVAIGLILLSALICFLYILGIGHRRGVFSFFKIVPLIIIIGVITYIVVKMKEAGVDPVDTLNNSQDLWKVFGIGIYFTLVGSLLLAFSRGRR